MSDCTHPIKILIIEEYDMTGKTIGLIFVWAVIASISVPTIIIAHSWKAPKEASDRQNPAPKDQDSIERGKALYRKCCASCHGKNGQGDGPLATKLKPKPADLVHRAIHHSDGDFAWKITNGRGTMPAFKDQLSENEIWDLINYLMSLN
jgi:mono/diheme cytochrome c family protein